MNNNSRSSPSNIDTTCMNQPSSHLNILLTPPQMGENSCTVIPSSHMNILNNVAANPNVIKKTKTPDICSSSIPNSITDRLNSNNSFPPATANCSRDMQSYASVLSNLRISLGRVRLETIHQSRALDESSSKSKLTHKFDAAKFAADFESELQSSTTEPSSQASSDCETTHDEVEDNSESEGNNIFTLEALPGIIPITMSNSAAILPSHQLKLRRKLMAREAKLNLPPGTLIERYERRLREENEIRRAGCHQDDASASSSASSIVSEAFEDVAIDLVEHFRRLKVFKKFLIAKLNKKMKDMIHHVSSCNQIYLIYMIQTFAHVLHLPRQSLQCSQTPLYCSLLNLVLFPKNRHMRNKGAMLIAYRCMSICMMLTCRPRFALLKPSTEP